ncbi:hypothetical protein SDRG_08734 [Saprolegnia diclina VS20]|uniref:Uncharacterized protein n=1 Tax=Saprolegnia diclina (strain VS20) TaxID=1156394 RepID=T0QIS2_SAPDV|nr:hypothetical protein SDRG_08734 [Saprolegnia diclina VS20]EQC33630.1 hypothetical protein SDRG_08734 [Saprolegnia diclina VS20]|eukprot:XP_008612853.1 hypothetical protein SDRG_08734 [Saprolegnia diclina VS20]
MGFSEDGMVVDMAMIQRQLALLSSLGILQGNNTMDRPSSFKALLASPPLTTTTAGSPHEHVPFVAPLVVAKTQYATDHRAPLPVPGESAMSPVLAGPAVSNDTSLHGAPWRLRHTVAQWTWHVQRAQRMAAIELQWRGRLRLQPRRLLARVFAKIDRHRRRHATIRILVAVRQSCRAHVVWRLLRWNVLYARMAIRVLALAFPTWANAVDAKVHKAHASMTAQRAMIDWRLHTFVDEHMGGLRLAQACRRWRAILDHARAASILTRMCARSSQQRAFLALVQATCAGRVRFKMRERYLQQCITTWKTRAAQSLSTALQMLAMDDWQCRRSVQRWHHHVAHQQRQREAVQWAETKCLQRHWLRWSRCLPQHHQSWRRVQTWSTHKQMRRAFQSWRAWLNEMRRQSVHLQHAAALHQRRLQRRHFAYWRLYLAHRQHSAQARTMATRFHRHQCLRAGVAALWMRQHRDRNVRVRLRAATLWHQRALLTRMLQSWQHHVAWSHRMRQRLDAFHRRRTRYAYWFHLWQAATLEQQLEQLGDAWWRQRRLPVVWRRWRQAVHQQQYTQLQHSNMLRWQLRHSVKHWRQLTVHLVRRRRRLDRFVRRRIRQGLRVYWQTWRQQTRAQRAVRQCGVVVQAQVQRRVAIACYCIVSSLVAQRRRQLLARALCMWQRYRRCVRQSVLAAYIGHRAQIQRVLHRWKAVRMQRRCWVVWHCYAAHLSRTARVSGRQRLEWRRRRQQSQLRACFRTWQRLLEAKESYLDAVLHVQLVCVSDLVTYVRHRAAADGYFVMARFRHWQRVATRGKRIADQHCLMRRARPVLVAWWKLVLQAKQTYLVDQTRAMMRRHQRASAPLRSVVDTTPSLSTYGERYLQQRTAPRRVPVRRAEPTPMVPSPRDSTLLHLTKSEALPLASWDQADPVVTSANDGEHAETVPSSSRRDDHARSLTLEDLAALSSSHASQVSSHASQVSEAPSTPNVLERTEAPSLAHSSAASSTSSMHLAALMNADDDLLPQRSQVPPLHDDWCDVSCIQPAKHTFDVADPTLPLAVAEPAVALANKNEPESDDDPAVAALLAKHRRRLEALFQAHASSNMLALSSFLLLAKATGLFPALFTRRELSISFEAAAFPATTLTPSTFLRCLYRIAQLLLRDSPDATPSQRLQALLLVLDGHGSVLQKPIEVEPKSISKARQEASRARVDAILTKVAAQRLAKQRRTPMSSSPRRRSPRWTRGPLDEVYAATPPKITPSVLAQAMEKAQLRLLRRNLATRTALRSYEHSRHDAEGEVDLASSLLMDVGSHLSSVGLSTLE